MAEIKDKVVTVEALSTLHEHNRDTYMPMVDPTGSGTMTMNGSASFSGDMTVGSLMIGSKIKLVPVDDRIEIVFIDETTVES